VLVSTWPVVSYEYEPELVPQTNDTVTLPAVPREVRLPLSLAEVAATLLASFVVTEGGMVVVRSFSRRHS